VTKHGLVCGSATKVAPSHAGGTQTPRGFPEEEDTFCFRFRVDDDEMNVKGLKGKGFDELKGAAGRYKRRPGPGRMRRGSESRPARAEPSPSEPPSPATAPLRDRCSSRPLRRAA